MGLLELIPLACGLVGAAGIGWLEWDLYRARLLVDSEMGGTHDEVEEYPPKLFGDGGDGGE